MEEQKKWTKNEFFKRKCESGLVQDASTKASSHITGKKWPGLWGAKIWMKTQNCSRAGLSHILTGTKP